MPLIRLLFLWFFSCQLAACPVGMSPVALPFGTDGCRDDTGLRWVLGSAAQCPTGFDRAVDKAGNAVCRHGGVMAYEVDGGCPDLLVPGWDDAGRDVCLDRRGRPVVELHRRLE